MKTNKELPDFKGTPDYILPSLQIIHKYKKNWKKIWKELIKFAKIKLSSKAEEDNIVSAYITPPLRKLDLIEGEKDEIRLTANGIQCLECFQDGGVIEYKKRLGYILIRTDEQNANFLSEILLNHDSKNNSISIEEFAKKLGDLGIKVKLKGTRIRGWLSLLYFVDLIDYSENANFFLIKSQYDVLLKGEKQPKPKEFFEALQDATARLRFLTRGSPYIPIPEVRIFVCKKLGISTFTFDHILRNFPSTYKNRRIIFETPTRRVTKGLTLRGKYYYFIGLF